MGVYEGGAYGTTVTGGGGGSVAWGGITGDLSNQADLTTALNGKQPIDGDLSAIAALTGTTGYLVKTGENTWELVTPGFQPSDGDLTAIAALSTLGYLRRTAANTWQTDLGVTISQSTTGTNDTVNVGTITSSAPSTNAHIAIIPKGQGGIIAAIPDGLSSGGNTRGVNAVDFLLARNSPTQIASGSNAVLSGGLQNTASGSASTVSGGSLNLASGNRSTVIGGDSNTASGSFSVAGGNRSHTFGRYGAFAFSSGLEATNGDAQILWFVHRNRTSDTTATSLTADSATVRSSNNIFFVQTNSIQTVKGLLNVIQESTANVASFEITFVVARGATAATTVIKGTPIVTSLVNDLGIVFTPANIKADTTNGGAYLEVVGLAATNLQWVFSGYLTENKY